MDNNFRAKLGLVIDKSAIAKIKAELEEGIKIDLKVNTSGSGESQIVTLKKETEKLTEKVEKLKSTQKSQSASANKEYDNSITKLKQMSTWTSRIEKMKISNPKAFEGGNENSDKVVADLGKAESAINAYDVTSKKLDKAHGKVAMDDLSVSLKRATQQTYSLSNMLEIAGKKFLSWMTVTQIAMKVIQGIKLMVTNVIALDTALIELAKVTDMNDDALSAFSEKAFEASSLLSRTGEEYIKASAGFKRSGYTIKESFDLANEALMMMNIGDGINDVDTAVSTLISTLKAYNLTANDARNVNDLINEVSNKSAISFDKLAEGNNIPPYVQKRAYKYCFNCR